jgi:hypothetical protein
MKQNHESFKRERPADRGAFRFLHVRFATMLLHAPRDPLRPVIASAEKRSRAIAKPLDRYAAFSRNDGPAPNACAFSRI